MKRDRPILMYSSDLIAQRRSARLTRVFWICFVGAAVLCVREIYPWIHQLLWKRPAGGDVMFCFWLGIPLTAIIVHRIRKKRILRGDQSLLVTIAEGVAAGVATLLGGYSVAVVMSII